MLDALLCCCNKSEVLDESDDAMQSESRTTEWIYRTVRQSTVRSGDEARQGEERSSACWYISLLLASPSEQAAIASESVVLKSRYRGSCSGVVCAFLVCRPARLSNSPWRGL